ncbi:MAG: PIN domain-containing protein [Hyphomonadaceae bacterium]|nr:PIN domain-containing protein [Hyphomonadaceae bacterium]
MVDTSVWVAHFRKEASPAAQLLWKTDVNDVVVGDIVLLECLKGARDEAHAGKLEAALRAYNIVAMLDEGAAVESARNYRRLRGLGHTPRKAADLIIATFCIRRGYLLLHQDKDFAPMEAHLGLRAA